MFGNVMDILHNLKKNVVYSGFNPGNQYRDMS